MPAGPQDHTVAAQQSDRLGRASEMLTRFVEGSPELREAALFAPDGRQIFATDEIDRTDGAAGLWGAAGAGERPVAYIHVGTVAGEVLAVRTEAGSALALADRFPLASLVLSDLRAVLRELTGEGGS